MMAVLGRQAARFEKVGRDLAETRGRGAAANGTVVVEVSADGSLTGLTIDPRAMRLGSEALAQAILKAAKDAEHDVAAQANQVMEPLLDADIWDDPPPS